MLFYFALSQLDESRMADSIVKSWGVVEYKYAGWDVKNFDTLPVSDSIPTPKGEWEVLNGYEALHVKGRWEYYRRDWKTYEFKPLLGSHLYDHPPDLLDWGRYLVFYIRGKGRFKIGFTYIYTDSCRYWTFVYDLSPEWREVRLRLDTGRAMYGMQDLLTFLDTLDPLEELPAIWCYDEVHRKYIPLSMSITPLADTFGTYEYEIELSPVYLVK